MSFDDMSEQTHEFPAGPTNNYDPYYPDGYEDDEFDYEDGPEYDFESVYDDDTDDDLYEPARLERFRWSLDEILWKFTHPRAALMLLRERISWRLAKCQVCGKRGTMNGEVCHADWIPF